MTDMQKLVMYTYLIDIGTNNANVINSALNKIEHDKDILKALGTYNSQFETLSKMYVENAVWQVLLMAKTLELKGELESGSAS